MEMIKSLGKHWLLDFYECDWNILNSVERIEEIMNEAVRLSGTTCLSSNFHSFEPQGVSGVIIISESHFTIHTWPEHRYAAIDAFVCGDYEIDKSFDYLKIALNSSESIRNLGMHRGILTGNRKLSGIQELSMNPNYFPTIEYENSTVNWKDKYIRDEAWGILTSVDIHDCDHNLITSEKHVAQFAIDLCDKIEMKRFGDTVVVDFGEDEKVAGFSMTQLIETSLISGHFANLSNNAYIDVFSCKYYEPKDVAEFSMNYFNGKNYTMNICVRK